MYSCCKAFTMSSCVSILALSLEIKGKASEMIPCPDKPRLQLRADSRKPRPAAPRRKTWRLLHSVVREEVQKPLLNLMNTVLGQVSRFTVPFFTLWQVLAASTETCRLWCEFTVSLSLSKTRYLFKRRALFRDNVSLYEVILKNSGRGHWAYAGHLQIVTLSLKRYHTLER